MNRPSTIAALAAAALLTAISAFAQAPKLKVGFMLPYSGTPTPRWVTPSRRASASTSPSRAGRSAGARSSS